MPDFMPAKGCCGGACMCCPYGCTYTIPLLLALASMVLTSSATFGCAFFKTKLEDYEILGTESEVDFRVGPWSVENFIVIDGALWKPIFSGSNITVVINGTSTVVIDGEVWTNNASSTECVGWNEHYVLDKDDLDGAMVFSRFVTMFTWIGAFIFTLALVFAGCMPLAAGLLKTISFFYLVFGVFMMLSLVALASDLCKEGEECYLEGTGICAVLAFFAWIGAGLSILTMREREARIPTAPQLTAVQMTNQQTNSPEASTMQTVEQTIIENDGTVVKVTTKTTTQADGSKTINETREVIKQGRPPVVSAFVIGEAEQDICVVPAKPY